MFLLLPALAFAFAAKSPELEAVKKVYMLPMGGSFDQYLASQLTQAGFWQVVTDPQKADALFTDKIGEPFEQKMADLYPPEVKETQAEEEKEEQDPSSGAVQRVGSFSRGRGMVYLVDRGTRNVIWSIYSPIRSSRPDDVNRRAEGVVNKLRKDLRSK